MNETPNGKYITDPIKIELAAIPDYVREDLAQATLESIRSFLRQPGGREFLESKKAAKKAKK